MKILLPILGLFVTCTLGSAEPKLDRTKLDSIATVTEEAIKRGDCPGAVVLVLHQNEVVYRKAFGQSHLHPDKKAMTVDAIFDMASLTKPIATGTAIMLLQEQGKLQLTDLVTKHWPEFGNNGKDKVTINHLLVHTSGLIADNPLADYQQGKEHALKKITELKLEQPAGTKFKYSDVGFITLGVIVEKITGQALDDFTRKQIFEPLKMNDTCYRPTKSERIVPTHTATGTKWELGTVHDPRARSIGGVAGHAGLFSTADDLAIYARVLLNQGKGLLKAETVKTMTEPFEVPGGCRSRSWDVATSFSSPRGTRFGKIAGFGHTGYTGTSLWIDRTHQVAIIVLTNRVHISDKVQVTTLRRAVADVVADAFGIPAQPKD